MLFNLVNKSNNYELSVLIAKVLNMLAILCSYILEHYNDENKRNSTLCSSTKSKQHCIDFLTCLNRSMQMLEDLERAVLSGRTSLSPSDLCKPIKLTDAQKQRKWSAEPVLKQKHLQVCLSCGHKSTNYPPEIEVIASDKKG